MTDNVTRIQRDWEAQINQLDPRVDHLQGPVHDFFIKPGSQYIGELEDAQARLTKLFSVSFASIMSPDEIEKLAGDMGVHRLPGSKARGTVYLQFATQPIQDTTTIPRNTRVSTRNGQYAYLTTEDVIVVKDQLNSLFNISTQRYEVPVTVEAEDIGPEYQTGPFTITNVESQTEFILTVENRTAIEGGSFAETDADLISAIKETSLVRERGLPQGLLTEIRNVEGVNNAVTDAVLVTATTGRAEKIIYTIGEQLLATEEIFAASAGNVYSFGNLAVRSITSVILDNQPLDPFAYDFNYSNQTLIVDSEILETGRNVRVAYVYNAAVNLIQAQFQNTETDLFGTTITVREAVRIPIKISMSLVLQPSFSILNVEPKARRFVLETINVTSFTSAIARQALIESVLANIAGVVSVSISEFNTVAAASAQVEVVEFQEFEVPSLDDENLAIQ